MPNVRRKASATKTEIGRGVSKREWFESALRMMSDIGLTGTTVERLAEALGTSRSGFYWHFENKDDLLNQLLEYWAQELTEVVTENEAFLALAPKDRLIKTAETILERDLTRYEIAIRHWALQNKRAARVVKRVTTARLEYLRRTFSELGFTGDDLEMRAMLFTCYHTWERPMFGNIPRKRLRNLIASRIELLITDRNS